MNYATPHCNGGWSKYQFILWSTLGAMPLRPTVQGKNRVEIALFHFHWPFRASARAQKHKLESNRVFICSRWCRLHSGTVLPSWKHAITYAQRWTFITGKLIEYFFPFGKRIWIMPLGAQWRTILNTIKTYFRPQITVKLKWISLSHGIYTLIRYNVIWLKSWFFVAFSNFFKEPGPEVGGGGDNLGPKLRTETDIIRLALLLSRRVQFQIPR